LSEVDKLKAELKVIKDQRAEITIELKAKD